MPIALLDRPTSFPPRITNDATRREFLLGGLATIGLLAACGRDTAAPPPAQVQTLIDDRGEVPLDRVPERIVTLYEESTELIVALGLKPVGVGSSRIDASRGERVFDGYYLSPQQIGSPTFVGSEQFNLEAIAALNPDLILPGFPDDVLVPALEKIGPTAMYDISAPSGWAGPLRRLGALFGREQQAAATIDAYARDLARARQTLAPIVAAAPRITALYPNYGGGDNTWVFGREFAMAAVFPELGFELVGIEKTAPVEPGYADISLELIPDIDTDTIVAFGPTDWTETPAATILSTLDVPVLSVLLRADQPSTGPLTSGLRLAGIVEALQKRTTS